MLNLTVTSGTLGLRPTEASAEGLTATTNTLLRDFCTPSAGLVRQAKAPSQERDLDMDALESSIKSKVSILVSDAAASVLLSSDMLGAKRPRASSGAIVSDMPNVKIVGRDCAHASTRLLKNPFRQHDALNSLMNEFVTGSNSFAQKVFHSDLFKGWWKEAIQGQQEEGPEDDYQTGTGICSAKHRFASHALPLGRMAKNAAAVLAVCHRVHAVRGDQALWSAQLLKHLDGKKLLLLSMAADAAHVALDFTRLLDEEGADIAQLNDQAAQFGNAIRSLFVDGEVLRLPTFTNDMLRQLEGSGLAVLLDGTVRELCASPDDKRSCLQIMREWVQGAEACLQAEFPSWRLLASFGVFNLKSRKTSKPEDPAAVRDSLCKLAKVFGLNAPALTRQYAQFAPIALGLQKQGSFSNRAAWAEAIARTKGSRASTRAKFAAKELEEAGH